MASKKSIIFLGLVGLSLFFFFPLLTGAETEPADANFSLIDCGREVNDAGMLVNPCGFDDFLQLAERLLKFLVFLASSAATIAFVYGGIILLTAGSSEGKRSNAKEIIWSAVIGLVIVFAAFIIVRTLVVTLVSEDQNNPTSERIRDIVE